MPYGSELSGELVRALFVAFLVAASVTDVRSRRIPNRLVLAFACTGLLIVLLFQPTLAAVARALGAMALGFALWIPFYALRMLGAGDVKLFAAAGLWLLPWQVVQASLIAALFGGVLSLAGMVAGYGTTFTVFRLVHGVRHPATLMETAADPTRRSLPYGVAMALGLATAVLFPGVLALA